MKVVVTGGSGLAGRHTVEHLIEQGYDVESVDLTPPSRQQCAYTVADLTDIGQVYGSLIGADAVVHLAAIPRPGFDPNEVVFRTNVLSAFNVLEVAATLGIRRVVMASSISVLGFPFYYRSFAPSYVPIDEKHPKQPQDPYALSKTIGEEMAEAYARRADMTIISLRLAWIHTRATFREQLMPMWDDPAAGASNLWGYIDARDAAQAVRLALESDLVGHHAFFVAAPDSFMRAQSSEELVRQFYPDTEIRPGLQGRASLFSSARAARILGFRPQYRWESYFSEEG